MPYMAGEVYPGRCKIGLKVKKYFQLPASFKDAIPPESVLFYVCLGNETSGMVIRKRDFLIWPEKPRRNDDAAPGCCELPTHRPPLSFFAPPDSGKCTESS